MIFRCTRRQKSHTFRFNSRRWFKTGNLRKRKRKHKHQMRHHCEWTKKKEMRRQVSRLHASLPLNRFILFGIFIWNSVWIQPDHNFIQSFGVSFSLFRYFILPMLCMVQWWIYIEKQLLNELQIATVQMIIPRKIYPTFLSNSSKQPECWKKDDIWFSLWCKKYA